MSVLRISPWRLIINYYLSVCLPVVLSETYTFTNHFKVLFKGLLIMKNFSNVFKIYNKRRRPLLIQQWRHLHKIIIIDLNIILHLMQ